MASGKSKTDLTTFGSEALQSLLFAMKVELDLWRHLLDLYTKFEINISKHVEEKPGKSIKNLNRANMIPK